MKLFFFLTCLLSFNTVSAEVTHEHVDTMLNQMVREHVISAEEANKARARMRTMSPEQWKQINAKGAEVAARSPASVKPSDNKIEEVQNVDLDGAQFKQIQDDIKKFVPEYRD